MGSLNRVYLMGRLTRDVELRYTPKGTAVTEVGLAVNHTWTDENGQKQAQVTFFEVTVWGKQAEIAQRYTQRGSALFIEGRLQFDTWDDKQTGERRSKLRVIGENLQLLGGKPAVSGPSSTGRPTAAATSVQPSRPAPAPNPDLDI